MQGQCLRDCREDETYYRKSKKQPWTLDIIFFLLHVNFV
ncbi:hypothetical protein N665_0383s0160 [Sinapis alba]|nr:hypothetical protein N665_0383s0160 [Sinapis alba]